MLLSGRGLRAATKDGQVVPYFSYTLLVKKSEGSMVHSPIIVAIKEVLGSPEGTSR